MSSVLQTPITLDTCTRTCARVFWCKGRVVPASTRGRRSTLTFLTIYLLCLPDSLPVLVILGNLMMTNSAGQTNGSVNQVNI